VSHNPIVVDGHQGEPRFCSERYAQVLDKWRHDGSMVSECAVVNLRDRRLVL
jgi:hypothetical protein